MILKNPNNDTQLSDIPIAGWIEINQEELDAIRESRRVILPSAIASISPRQIRQVLTRTGLRAAVEGAVALGDQEIKDWWEFSTTFERLNPQVVAMGAALGQSDAHLDSLWALGASL